jgi:hypothetical protein
LLLLSTLTVYVRCLALATTGIGHLEFDIGTGCISPIIPTLVTISMIITTCSCFGSSFFACSIVCIRPITAMSASTLRPCSFQKVFAMMGGGIHADQHAWVVMPTTVDEKHFVMISSKDKGCKRFVCNNFAMVHHITHLRNKKVHELMLELSKENDPDAGNAQHAGTLSMPRELFDSLPSILTIDVATTSMVTSVNVLPSWQTNEELHIEIRQANLDLLLEEPPAEAAPWTPTIEPPDEVYWLLKFSSDRASMLVEFSSDMDDDAKRDAINSAAAELQAFYSLKDADAGDDVCWMSPGRAGSLFLASRGWLPNIEAGDGVSAESAQGEPVHTSSPNCEAGDGVSDELANGEPVHTSSPADTELDSSASFESSG